MTETEAHLLRMLYELSEFVYYALPEGIGRTRVAELREIIREDYAPSIWKDLPLQRGHEKACGCKACEFQRETIAKLDEPIVTSGTANNLGV